MIAVEVLAEIEDILREKAGGKKSFVLADYFDYIAGTSTGGIIAACLSLGMSVAKIRKFYEDSGEEMFDKASILKRFRYKFEDEKLSKVLRDEIGANVTLGSNKLRTLLMLVLRNATTDSPWPLSNNPYAKFNDRSRADCNLKLPLWQLVRASTAAPTYFPPETVDLGNKKFVFVDGGITTYNNPAFQLFLMSTTEPYKLNWPTGEKEMLVVSIGTGTSPSANENLSPTDMNLIYNAGSIPSALMFAALNEQDFLCRVFGKCLAGDPLDLEVGTMVNKKGPVKDKLFTYVRYNAELSKKGLRKLGLPKIDPEKVQKLDSVKGLPQLKQVGKAIAKNQVKARHFDNF
jgi:hypothetical protein